MAIFSVFEYKRPFDPAAKPRYEAEQLSAAYAAEECADRESYRLMDDYVRYIVHNKDKDTWVVVEVGRRWESESTEERTLDYLKGTIPEGACDDCERPEGEGHAASCFYHGPY